MMVFMSWLQIMGKISEFTYISMILWYSVFAIILWGWCEIYKCKRFSGSPFYNDKQMKRCKYIRNIVLFMIFGRFIEIIIGLYMNFYYKLSKYDVLVQSSNDNVYGIGFYFTNSIELLFNEFLIGIFVLDKGFIEQFHRRVERKTPCFDSDNSLCNVLQEDNYDDHTKIESEMKNQSYQKNNISNNLDLSGSDMYNMMSDKETQKNSILNLLDSNHKSNGRSRNSYKLSMDRESRNSYKLSTDRESIISQSSRPAGFINKYGYDSSDAEDQVDEIKPIFSRKNGLGNIFKCKISNKIVKVREVSLDSNFSPFVLNGIPNQLKFWKGINNPNIEIIKKATLSNQKQYLISDYNETMTTLTNYILNNRKILKLKEKAKLMEKIATIMKILVSNEPISINHGHLSPENILISDDGKTIKIMDIGFLFLKKYCGYFGYCNKTQYTSVELLGEKGAVGCTVTEKVDVYSFGLISWFILFGEIPFNGLSQSSIENYVLKENKRPKIPYDFNKDLKNLIRACWHRDANTRPTFDLIASFLFKIDLDKENN